MGRQNSSPGGDPDGLVAAQDESAAGDGFANQPEPRHRAQQVGERLHEFDARQRGAEAEVDARAAATCIVPDGVRRDRALPLSWLPKGTFDGVVAGPLSFESAISTSAT